MAPKIFLDGNRTTLDSLKDKGPCTYSLIQHGGYYAFCGFTLGSEWLESIAKNETVRAISVQTAGYFAIRTDPFNIIK